MRLEQYTLPYCRQFHEILLLEMLLRWLLHVSKEEELKNKTESKKNWTETSTCVIFFNFHFDWQKQSFKKAFNFMQSLIDNPNQQILDNSDKSDIDLDFESLNQDFEELVGSSKSTDR